MNTKLILGCDEFVIVRECCASLSIKFRRAMTTETQMPNTSLVICIPIVPGGIDPRRKTEEEKRDIVPQLSYLYLRSLVNILHSHDAYVDTDRTAQFLSHKIRSSPHGLVGLLSFINPLPTATLVVCNFL
jgi:hypothetical protein